uniref:Uncharacterized protein n=1 Tax=Pyxicephalus adspersus TaxID=30357 RepID=A0AAV3AK21_PYXAD|nr:TPA: hypothetical protein GDO54_011141 [Pyxicephalus adspersus]
MAANNSHEQSPVYELTDLKNGNGLCLLGGQPRISPNDIKFLQVIFHFVVQLSLLFIASKSKKLPRKIPQDSLCRFRQNLKQCTWKAY